MRKGKSSTITSNLPKYDISGKRYQDTQQEEEEEVEEEEEEEQQEQEQQEQKH